MFYYKFFLIDDTVKEIYANDFTQAIKDLSKLCGINFASHQFQFESNFMRINLYKQIS